MKHLAAFLVLSAALAFLAPGAGAQSPAVWAGSGVGTITGATIGTTSAQVLPAVSARTILSFWNLSSSAIVCLNPGTSAATITGSTCAPGEIPVGPGANVAAGAPGFVASDAFQGIASAAATPLTIQAK